MSSYLLTECNRFPEHKVQRTKQPIAVRSHPFTPSTTNREKDKQVGQKIYRSLTYFMVLKIINTDCWEHDETRASKISTKLLNMQEGGRKISVTWAHETIITVLTKRLCLVVHTFEPPPPLFRRTSIRGATIIDSIENNKSISSEATKLTTYLRRTLKRSSYVLALTLSLVQVWKFWADYWHIMKLKKVKAGAESDSSHHSATEKKIDDVDNNCT